MPELRTQLDPPFTDELRQQLISIWTAVSNAGGAVGFVPPVTEDDVRVVADTAFARIGRGDDHLIVGYVGGRPVGFLFLEKRPGPLFRHWMTIKRLQVHPDHQGSGVGSRLLEATHGIALGLGLEQLHLTVRGGTGTDALYRRHGYEVMARIPDVIRLSPDDTREEIYMVKKLVENAAVAHRS